MFSVPLKSLKPVQTNTDLLYLFGKNTCAQRNKKITEPVLLIRFMKSRLIIIDVVHGQYRIFFWRTNDV